MTLDELKLEAKKLSYHLVKDKAKITLLPCPICGKKKTHEWYDAANHDKFRRCEECGEFDGNHGKTSIEVKLGWNMAVENFNKVKEDKNG